MREAADWRPSASADAIRLRARLNALIRAFFAEREVLEVETPVLSVAGVSDPHIAPFQLEFNGRTDGAPRTRWLRTSPEYALKRLLAAGIGDCYELGRVFRDGEAGGRHNPEFTLLEWYRPGLEHHALAGEVIALLQRARALAGLAEAAVRMVSYRDLFIGVLGLDPFLARADELQSAFGDGIDPAGLTRDDWLDLLLTHRIEPGFAPDTLTVLHGYPASQCALARVDAGPPPSAQRFEVYWGALELANGYHELTDPHEQARRFASDHSRRAQLGIIQPPADVRLLAALTHGLPDCAGVALGVDRLLMAMTGTRSIADVVAFDFARA